MVRSITPTLLRLGLANEPHRELAELLGQVKPPVATREDIDKSGLQIIKTSDLEEYERQGRVASNCIERVSLSALHASIQC